VTALQGEFGIGLLSFWTVGDELTMTSTGADQRAYQMVMHKGDPGYTVAPKRALFGEAGSCPRSGRRSEISTLSSISMSRPTPIASLSTGAARG
jgi:hypothetical protein